MASVVSRAKAEPKPVFKRELALLRMQYTLLGKAEWWWIMDDTIAAISKRLQKDNYVVVDGFLGDDHCRQLRDEVKAAEGTKREGGRGGRRKSKRSVEMRAEAGGSRGQDLLLDLPQASLGNQAMPFPAC